MDCKKLAEAVSKGKPMTAAALAQKMFEAKMARMSDGELMSFALELAYAYGRGKQAVQGPLVEPADSSVLRERLTLNKLTRLWQKVQSAEDAIRARLTKLGATGKPGHCVF